MQRRKDAKKNVASFLRCNFLREKLIRNIFTWMIRANNFSKEHKKASPVA
jgi:hypothetical protein